MERYSGFFGKEFSLKPCPSCKSTDLRIHADKSKYKGWYDYRVSCNKCGFTGEPDLLNQHIAVSNWNGGKADECGQH